MRHPLSFAVLGCLSLAGLGAEISDPFATEAMAPPRPSPALAGRQGGSPCAAALPATALTAIDAVDLALCNNPQTREVWANARAQAALVGVAEAAWLPSLNGSVAVSRNWKDGAATDQRSAALVLSWLLFDFGTRSANGEIARQLLAASAATQDATVQQLFLSALQSYYSAQATRAGVEAAREAERASQESYLAADTRYRVGVATPADRLQAQTAWSQATLNRIRAEGDARNALGTLANVLGFDAPQPFVLAEFPAAMPTAGFERDVNALIDEARRRRPDLRSAEAQVNAAQATVKAARANGLPTLSLAAGPTWQDVGGNSTGGGVLGVTLSLPLFSGFETTYRVRSAQALAEARAAQRDRVRQQVALDVWRAYQSLATSTQALKTAADLVASAEASERVALGRYKAGVGNILDVLNAQSALAAARQQRIQASLDWNVYRATLAQSVGALDYGLLQPMAEGNR
ncbi:MAG: Outer rane efflux protein [Rhodocyclaceae bacterium]|nr:Outer rane efflux protein [Rhodocyclaceae bacterium]